ncbi:MAG: MFS transporter, partial [Chloroflexi bacterium]|nr:MFS transporter [Chloroflexota bacterium]
VPLGMILGGAVASFVGNEFALLMGVLIARVGWMAPFPLLSLLGFLALFAIYRIMPPDAPAEPIRATLLSNFAVVFASNSARAGLVVIFLVSISNELVFLILGIWLEDSFGLQIAALGAVTIVIGLAELGGEGLVSGLVDRLGKRRAVAIGLVGNSLAAIALPLLGVTIPGALLGLFLYFISFEFTFVSSLPLMTEIIPKKRATYMALIFAGASLGRAAADFIGVQVFSYGFLVSALAAAGVNVLALVVLRDVRVAAEESS